MSPYKLLKLRLHNGFVIFINKVNTLVARHLFLRHWFPNLFGENTQCIVGSPYWQGRPWKVSMKALGSEVLPTFQVQVLGTVDALAGGRLVHFQCVCVAIIPTDCHIVPLVVI